MKLKTLQDLYVDQLKDLFNAENQLLKALPKMAKAATAPQLAKAFTEHLAETKGQIERLETIFTELDISPQGKTCRAMAGLLEEGAEAISEDAEPCVRDAALIAAAQRVEHYEMAGYGCVRTFARLLGHKDAADLLQTTLDEEGSADKKLTKLAESIINSEAVSPVARPSGISGHSGCLNDTPAELIPDIGDHRRVDLSGVWVSQDVGTARTRNEVPFSNPSPEQH